MTSYKEHQKELKAPDELQKLGQQAVPWLEQHGKNVVVAVVVTLLIVGGALFARDMSKKSEEKATQDFGDALRVLTREVNASPPAAPPVAGEEPPFKTEQEKEDALVAKLTEFRKANAGRKAAASAALPLAQALLRQGKAAEAAPLLDEYLGAADPADALRPAALEAKGYALEAQGKLDDALAAFDLLAKENKTDFLKGMGLYHRGRVLLLKGDSAGAAKQFADLETQAPNTAAARLAKERSALLTAQGVAVPVPTPAPAATPDAGP